MAAELSPDIVLFHILPRLPAKSVARFKCVSKGWHSFLTTPMFTNMHLHHQNRHKLLFIPKTSSSCTFRTIDCESPKDGLTAPRCLPFDSPRNVSIITSFNGLVCVGIIQHDDNVEEEYYSDLVLWNPLTGEYRILSKTNAHKECYETTTRASVLYYTSSEDDYKLLRVTNSCDAYIYSLKSDLWRKIESTENFHRWISNHCALLNGKLYFLKYDKAINKSHSVISIDLKTEKFTEVTTPFFRDSTICMGFTVLRGCIHVWMLHHSNFWRHKIELWRMDGDGWTKVVTFTNAACGCTWPWCVQPLHLMADGNWLMRYGERLCITDPNDHPNDPLKSTRVVTYMGAGIRRSGKYIETLVSPNQYMK
ncbi:putative F-box domain, galactose oxidase/kelch, beta-propeller, kelch-type beta propeller [Helianthus annuus]|uniref:F-box domain, galactose oxidase/kelch, beta-propeller, kelch-type beta propeller n=1 Tax=Helianthus annuus TaxID=4232 RepID=A0A251SYC4_HELAN|nr:putative F-box protein At1g60370 [Helianthus annuus]KAF5776368.1 putative F-box domain, galactose oxidase/kelch, beta-propeller, kelch-type beta propeller [Helianthus annuus]KAJ0503905.1 putative F-box domain, galactose oxidase/kelch, beta-propeller, kelch-type beta propeller [Helianthus annuus]KAJ0676948.1 putative F-box domain, galactose oxidase/kelch, beta-propeller, kelch-type beta propeller [Helianthus annuus]KAJ0817384.1 putative F-box domain, galactose oxidase/kelch, beta-propeller, k